MPASVLGNGSVMSAKDKTPNLRFFAFAALVIAAGVLALRVYDLFGPDQAQPIGSSVETEIVYLLEPIVGVGQVRVSVTGTPERTVLVMVNGDPAGDVDALRNRVSSILAATMGFDAEQDRLVLEQFIFARGTGGALSLLQIMEISGLAVLVLTLAAMALGPGRSSRDVLSQLDLSPPAAPVLPSAYTASRPPLQSDDLSQASEIARSKPTETAALVRNWMSYKEE